MKSIHRLTISYVTELTDLTIPESRFDHQAKALSQLPMAANELNRQMSAEEMSAVTPAVCFLSCQPTDGQLR